jgi:serine phosphatase RsbU (regulator of sigma subunit)
MSYFDRNPNQFRIIFGVIATYLLALVVITFYRYGSSPTDENLFMNPPSSLYVTKTVAPSPLLVGDLILTVDDESVDSLSDLNAKLLELEEESKVAVDIHRLREDKGHSFVLTLQRLKEADVRQLSPTAYVIDVPEGGASHRAGMEVGDLIMRINGQTFANAIGADSILRSGQIGKALAYDVLRHNKVITLHVTLASFGFQFSSLVAVFSGLAFIGVGGFIALRRPRIAAARMLGSFLLALGFVLAVLLIRRDPGLVGFGLLINSALMVSVFFSFPLWLHSSLYFPKENPEIIRRRWVPWVGYGVAILTITIFLVAGGGNLLLSSGLGLLLLYNVGVRVGFRKSCPKEHRKLMRPLRWAWIVCGGLSALLILYIVFVNFPAINRVIGYIGAALLLIPGAYLYIIGRHRLLDLELHIRRSVQYGIIASLWRAATFALFVWLILLLSEWDPQLPNIRSSANQVEVMDTPMSPERLELYQNILMMVVSLGLAFVFWKLGRKGTGLIAEKFHRAKYDYRRAANELAEVMATKITMNSLARGIVEKLAGLMQLKRVGVLFFRNQEACCCQEAHGFDGTSWKEFCVTRDLNIAEALMQFRGEIRVEYLPPEIKEEFRKHEFQYLIPIRSKEKLVGTLMVGEKLSESTFQQEDLEFLGAAAKQASVAIENAFLYEELAEQERLKLELEIARRIQMDSLPQGTPTIEGLDVAGVSIPAMEVGGDYFDYLNGSVNELTVVVGDVSGKGTSAALYMSKIQGILRSLYGFGLSPRELFVRTNKLLWNDLEKKSFVTAIGGSFDVKHRKLTLARAGHLPLFYYHFSERRVEKIIPKGMGLGLSEDCVFDPELEEKTFQFEAGDIFLFVTDGVTEGKRNDGDEFGEDRLAALLQSAALSTAEQIRDQVTEAVKSFAANEHQHDDQTVVVVRVV